jgi:hypothetical protein
MNHGKRLDELRQAVADIGPQVMGLTWEDVEGS